MNVVFMNGVCFAGGSGLISRKLCYLTREDETSSEFSVDVPKRQVL
jgi:hypothetical protein